MQGHEVKSWRHSRRSPPRDHNGPMVPGMSIAEAARWLGVTPATWARWERTRSPKWFDVVVELAKGRS